MRGDASEEILGRGRSNWPTDYYHGFDEPIAVLAAILSDAETWELAICWPEGFVWLEGCREFVGMPRIDRLLLFCL